jgi:nickel/cobalt transporter (NicO) family protein
MPDFITALQPGSTSLWIFIPTAILLGALHGLEPGHSKTMMAAFIIAIRGTIAQAVLLGLSAALSHSMIVALLAIAALKLGSQWNADNVEPYIQLFSAVFVVGMAVWMFLRTRRDIKSAHDHSHHHHHDGHDHADHNHGHEELFRLDTEAGSLDLSVYEDGVPPVFRLYAPLGETLPTAQNVVVETVRPNGARQVFAFAMREGSTSATQDDFLESTESIPEPHAFTAIMTIRTESDKFNAEAEFVEHHHDHAPASEFQDAHELEHAQDIKQRFAGQTVTTPQIVMFGVTGGLIPCPAAFSVLVICLQLKRIALGMTMVALFSFGLALTMVTTGVLAAWSVRHAQRRFSGFGEIMRRAPYISCAVLVLIAFYMAWHGWHGLAAQPTP